MALSPRLEISQSQGLVMTPQLVQSIKLLQLSNIELSAYVEAELERNPLIEWLEGEEPSILEKRGDGDIHSEISGDPPVATNEPDQPADWMQENLETSASAISDKLDSSLENIFPDDNEKNSILSAKPEPAYQSDAWSGTLGNHSASEGYDLEAFTASPITLRDHIAGQMALSGLDIAITAIGHELLDHMDESGYVRADILDIASRLNVTLKQVEDTLKLLQTFEPAGICARDLKECLKLQLREKDRLDPAMNSLIDNLELLAKRDFASLGKICSVSRDDLVDMMQEIQALDPKPGTAFETTPLSPIVPDVIISTASDGSWLVELNTETLPRILVNQSYFARVSKTTTDKKEIEFLNDCLQSANWLHKSLDQRAQTILKVATEIIRQQDDFLVNGVRHLRPLNLKTVADAISMHESTVSRVTSNKYMLTSRGTFELKYFFTTAIQSTGENDATHSSESVRHMIKQLIEDESPAKVLSDDKIAASLKNDGIDIARRTVAKYREAMHIASSVQRRREKKAFAAIKAKTR